MSPATFDEVDWSRFDFLDLGCSRGGSLDWSSRHFGGRGLGIDLNERKVEEAVAAGHAAVLADATQLQTEDAVRFVSMMDFLEHLPTIETVEAALRRAAAVARDFLFIRHPSFEGEGLVEQLGVRQYWWHWKDHRSHVQVADYCRIFETLGLDWYTIRYRGPVHHSSHPTVLPLGTANGQHEYDPSAHPPKPDVSFARPLWRRQDILVALRPLELSSWAQIVAAVDR